MEAAGLFSGKDFGRSSARPSSAKKAGAGDTPPPATPHWTHLRLETGELQPPATTAAAMTPMVEFRQRLGFITYGFQQPWRC
ncbi:hypothetical protein E3N88_08862 [Mikania micrantha]|uniref:Uncharacterized protein n=1 Tax=Mikania micrantha TaxID=192012 RepID=A0A5N6PJQ9_9ASTR|nr:hypothetical protein E3N88_08862 [Mikania micrantha]